jgi:hypothetical protein
MEGMAAREDDGEEWIEIRRYVDATAAEMTRDFLLEHDVAARLRGNTGATSVLNRFTTVIDTRLDVKRGQIDLAREALHALEIGDSVEDPFRGRRPIAPDEETPYVAPKKASAAMMLGFILPIGAGHFYARHGAAGGILFAGILASILGTIVAARPELAIAWTVIVVADIVLSPAAVRRFNEGKVPAEGTQRAVALGVLAVAFGAAFALGGGLRSY